MSLHLVTLAATLLLLPFATPSWALAGDGFSGAEVYAQSCAMCHTNGVAGAPKSGESDEWRLRMGLGRADLLRSVLRGKGAMPPKGGNASLSATEANAALDYMLSMLTKSVR